MKFISIYEIRALDIIFDAENTSSRKEINALKSDVYIIKAQFKCRVCLRDHSNRGGGFYTQISAKFHVTLFA